MKNAILIIMSMLFAGSVKAQCNWTQVYFESYEYTTVVPYIIPGMTYQNSPQTFAGCIHSGSRGLYLNIVDGATGLLYDQLFTGLCTSQQYRFSFWTRDAWSGTNDLTIQVIDANNAVLSTVNVINNSTWANITMPAFTPTTSTVRFQIITNMPGGAGNDAGFDDLKLEACLPQPYTTGLSQCAGFGSTDLYTVISASGFSSGGTWNGPSALQNGYAGTFTEGTNGNGTYVYTIAGTNGCPDSVANVQVQIVQTPDINPLGPVSSCGNYTLPVITGSVLAGNEHYFTGTNGTGTQLATGSQISTSQTIYIYGGASGCSDEETVQITISQPGNAGNNNGAAFCGPGPSVNINSFLSAGASSNGTWSETTSSGTFNPQTGIWNTANVAQGTYEFTYNVPANGACAADQAVFTLTIGNIPEVNLGNDTTLCTGQTMWLNAGTYDTYLWNNGSTNATKYVSQPGTYWVKVGTLGDNQIVNGDFEQGNTGFSTNYTPGNGGPWGLLSNPGTYAITTSPNLVHNNFNSCTDHTPAPGQNQLVVNGAATANTNVWCQTIPVQPNTTYQFGTWTTSVESNQPVAQLQFSINGTQLGSVFSPSAQGCSWSQFTQNWSSGMTTSAQICIVNQNTSGGGNDFAIDDITFKPICYSYDTIIVQYSAPPTVNLGPDQFVCEGTTVTLDVGNAGMNYLWNTTETTQTIDITTGGTYSVTVTNPNNCSASDNVVITYEQQLHAGNDSSDIICSTSPDYDLHTLLTPGTTPGGIWETLSATFGGAQTAGILSQLQDEAGSFDFRYILTGTYCPNDTSVMTLTIHQQPVAAADVSFHLCNSAGNTVDLSPYLNHPSAPLGGNWNIPAGIPAANFNPSTNTFDPNGLPHGNYTVEMILPAEEGCVSDTMHVALSITAMPVIQFSSDFTEGCQPLEIQFINESITQGTVVYSWDLGDGTQSGSSTTVSNTFEAAQCYDITLTATADGLCTSAHTSQSMICVHPVPSAAFYYGPQQVYSDGPTVDFTNTSIDHDFSSWSFGDGAVSGAEHPQHIYPIGDIGNYEVQLIVTTNFGCSDTTSQLIIVKDQLLYYVPNTFTPDGNAYNPVFIPVITAGIDEHAFKMEIYNRWGELVFMTTDVHEGWDGTFRNSSAQEGTYTWKIQFGLLESDEVKIITGHVNLIR